MYAKKYIFFISAGILVLIGAWYWYAWRVPNHFLHGVSPVTIYNHVGENAYINNDVSASLLMVLKQYGETYTPEKLAELNDAFFDPKDIAKTFSFSDIKNYLEAHGYAVKVFEISSPRDLRPYLNKKANLPILISHRIDVHAERPEIKFSPMGVIVGVKNNGRNILLHDFYWGFSKEITFEHLLTLAIRENKKSYGMVIVPKEGHAPNTAEEKEWVRTVAMDKAQYFLDIITFARVALNQQQEALGKEILRPIVEDQLFEEVVPPYYRVIAYSITAGGYMLEGPNYYAKADQLTQKAEIINHDLDKSFSDYWPGFLDMTNLVHGVSDGPYIARGYLYFYRDKNYGAAIDSFKKALEIWPYDVVTQRALNFALSAEAASGR